MLPKRKREFELDINESKTGIYSKDFRFLDSWPIGIAEELEQASLSFWSKSSKDKLRSVLESSFDMAVKHNDDGILKYTLRCIDNQSISDENWEAVEPFLKRVSVHYGHTIDYVVRILVHRYLKWRDLDVKSWHTILNNILEYHGSLGHDSEVCWLVYLNQRLGLKIHDEVVEKIVNNCGALAVLAVLNSVDDGLVSRRVFQMVWKQLSNVNDRNHGRLWPVILEWKSRKWPNHNQLNINDNIIQTLIDHEKFIYDSTKLPKVFHHLNEEEFEDVECAIESSDSFIARMKVTMIWMKKNSVLYHFGLPQPNNSSDDFNTSSRCFTACLLDTMLSNCFRLTPFWQNFSKTEA